MRLFGVLSTHVSSPPLSTLPALPARHRVAAWIDPAALRHNLARVRELAPGARVLAVIKANAYGHGMPEAVQAVGDLVDGFAVARLAEALALRRLWPAGRIVVLSECSSAALRRFAAKRLDPVVSDERQLKWLLAYRGEPVDVWLKVETGMHRLGLSLDAAREALGALQAAPGCREVVLMSHPACADEPDNRHTRAQLAAFENLPDSGPRSFANSAVVCAWPAGHYDWVRPGLMLYGASPIAGKSAESLGLLPVMHLVARLFQIKSIEAGATVGYGGGFVAPRAMRIGMLSAGYGDGYPAHVKEAGVVLHGAVLPVLGRVSMDMLAVDLSDCPAAKVGDVAVLWGAGRPVEWLAQASGRLTYELLCQVPARVPRLINKGG